MSNCGAIIVSRKQEGKTAADWIRNALMKSKEFNGVEVQYGENRNGNYVIKINFGRLSLGANSMSEAEA